MGVKHRAKEAGIPSIYADRITADVQIYAAQELAKTNHDKFTDAILDLAIQFTDGDKFHAYQLGVPAEIAVKMNNFNKEAYKLIIEKFPEQIELWSDFHRVAAEASLTITSYIQKDVLGVLLRPTLLTENADLELTKNLLTALTNLATKFNDIEAYKYMEVLKIVFHEVTPSLPSQQLQEFITKITNEAAQYSQYVMKDALIVCTDLAEQLTAESDRWSLLESCISTAKSYVDYAQINCFIAIKTQIANAISDPEFQITMALKYFDDALACTKYEQRDYIVNRKEPLAIKVAAALADDIIYVENPSQEITTTVSGETHDDSPSNITIIIA